MDLSAFTNGPHLVDISREEIQWTGRVADRALQKTAPVFRSAFPFNSIPIPTHD
jgi:hypothetical protein